MIPLLLYIAIAYHANYGTVLGYDDTEVCRRGALQ